MSNLDYTFAVARIRALESKLLNEAVMDQILLCETEQDAISVLLEKGWGNGMETNVSTEELLQTETTKTWEIMRQLNVDASVFEILFYPHLFHNLKAAIKEVCTEEHNPHIYYEDTSISSEEMVKMVKNHNFSQLSYQMAKVAEEAYETLLHTRDGQLCDLIVDRGCMESILEGGKKAKEQMLQDYGELVVALTNIKIAIRCARVAKPIDFVQKALVKCSSLSVEELARAAVNGEDAVRNYLLTTGYSDSVEALEQSFSAFECWSDNRLIDFIQDQKYVSFSVGPLLAYVIARESEIKTVGMILSGIANGLSKESIKGRIRRTYV